MISIKNQQQIFSQESLEAKLSKNRQLIIKYGIDATGSFLHLGHTVNLWMLRKFQELGHKVIIILGDFTTSIGDPTGKSESRPKLDKASIEIKCENLRSQINLILIQDRNLLEFKYNSDWYKNFNLSDFIQLLSEVTHAKLISRDMFQDRISSNKEIWMSELIYPILQGWDSVVIRSDITICGSDQLFNEMLGKFYQEKQGQEPQVIITSKITAGLCGVHKQSKSLNNYVGLLDSPKEKFGKLMTLEDHQIQSWVDVYTDVDDFIYNKNDPFTDKLLLAYEVVKKYHGETSAIEEKGWWLSTFSNKDFPSNASLLLVELSSISLLDLVRRALPLQSNTQIKELITKGAVKINNEKTTEPYSVVEISSSKLNLQVGKKIFYHVVKDN